MHYTVEPGLYAIGNPDDLSPVMVTANYKMSFDKLRKALAGFNAWILVLDTKGINVWCSAGKGTFGTEELVRRIESCGLDQVVSHRTLILPQLAAPGVAAHEVKRLSGFKVIYGPIRAEDLPAFLDAGLKATPEMRVKTFPLQERAGLIPVELVAAIKGGFFLSLVLFLISFFIRGNWSFALHQTLTSAQAILVGIFSGAILTPILLPWLPGRAFSLKGASAGGLATILYLWLQWSNPMTLAGQMERLAWVLIIPALSAFLAMNFTGASTYTSLSGVKKEMRLALPLQIGAGLMGLISWLGSQLMS